MPEQEVIGSYGKFRDFHSYPVYGSLEHDGKPTLQQIVLAKGDSLQNRYRQIDTFFYILTVEPQDRVVHLP